VCEVNIGLTLTRAVLADRAVDNRKASAAAFK